MSDSGYISHKYLYIYITDNTLLYTEIFSSCTLKSYSFGKSRWLKWTPRFFSCFFQVPPWKQSLKMRVQGPLPNLGSQRSFEKVCSTKILSIRELKRSTQWKHIDRNLQIHTPRSGSVRAIMRPHNDLFSNCRCDALRHPFWRTYQLLKTAVAIVPLSAFSSK